MPWKELQPLKKKESPTGRESNLNNNGRIYIIFQEHYNRNKIQLGPCLPCFYLDIGSLDSLDEPQLQKVETRWHQYDLFFIYCNHQFTYRSIGCWNICLAREWSIWGFELDRTTLLGRASNSNIGIGPICTIWDTLCITQNQMDVEDAYGTPQRYQG